MRTKKRKVYPKTDRYTPPKPHAKTELPAECSLLGKRRPVAIHPNNQVPSEGNLAIVANTHGQAVIKEANNKTYFLLR